MKGSGIGLGHPTGAWLIVTLLHAMANRKKNFSLATLCGGGGYQWPVQSKLSKDFVRE